MDHKRPDGRLPTELRDISISFDGLDGVDGSARFGFGETKALASISGPMEVRLVVEQAAKATFEVIVRPLAGLPGTDSKALSSALRYALLPSLILTNNPRTLVQLVALSLTPVHVPSPSFSSTDPNRRAWNSATLLRTGPALVASLINTSTLALLNASSVPLRGVICAVSVGRSSGTGELVVDPSEAELAVLDGAGTFAFLITGEKSPAVAGQFLNAQLVWSQWNATPTDEDELTRATELARVGALRVREHMKEAIQRNVLASNNIKREEEPSNYNVKDQAVEEVDDVKMEIS